MLKIGVIGRGRDLSLSDIIKKYLEERDKPEKPNGSEAKTDAH